MEAFKKEKGIGRKKDLIFYCLILIWPVLQFCIFYIYVNFNSFLLAFKDIKMDLNADSISKYTYTFSGKAFADLWELLKTKTIREAGLISLLTYGLSLFITMPLGLLFSFYISKKHFGAGFFRVMLFLPSILSSVVTVTVYTYFINQALPQMLEDVFRLKEVMPFMSRTPAWQFVMVFLYNLLVGFGVSVLMYANAMSGIDPEINEAAMLDGATGIKEFIYVALPMVFPTISVFIVTGIAGIFTNQFNLFSFYGNKADVPFQTFGYYLYKETQKYQAKNDMSHYPLLSALGIAMTVVAVPLTFLVRWLLEKYGPSED